jgi:hypothetical protein
LDSSVEEDGLVVAMDETLLRIRASANGSGSGSERREGTSSYTSEQREEGAAGSTRGGGVGITNRDLGVWDLRRLSA